MEGTQEFQGIVERFSKSRKNFPIKEESRKKMIRCAVPGPRQRSQEASITMSFTPQIPVPPCRHRPTQGCSSARSVPRRVPVICLPSYCQASGRASEDAALSDAALSDNGESMPLTPRPSSLHVSHALTDGNDLEDTTELLWRQANILGAEAAEKGTTPKRLQS